MGSALCTQEWVANRMNVDRRTVRNWVKRGLLKQTMQSGHPMYDHDEVEQMALERGTDFPVMNRKTFFEMQRKIQKLEESMNLVRRMLDIHHEPLRPNPLEAKQIYGSVTGALGVGTWSLQDMEAWAGVFETVDEATLVAFREATLVDHPWDPFFCLCVNMILQLSKTPEFKTNLQMQVVHRKLDEARKKLRGTAIIWTELNPQSPVRTLLRDLEDPHEDLKKRLMGNSK